MADARDAPRKGGLTRGKAIVIGVLAVVLLVVLYVQFGAAVATPKTSPAGNRPPHPSAAAQPAAAAVRPAAPADVKSTVAKKAAATRTIDPTRWKSPPVATVVAYDPFALPPSFPQPPRVAGDPKSSTPEGLIAAAAANDAKKLTEAVEKLRMQLKELEERGVHVIIREQDQFAAMIGDRMLHVGDEINGFTVTHIDPNDGVRVERKEAP